MIQKKYFFNNRQLEIVKILNNQINNKNILVDRNCALCNKNNFEKLSNLDRYGITYYSGICKNCGLVQQYSYPNEEFINLFYEQYYNDLYAFFDSPGARFKSQYNSAEYKYQNILNYFKNNIPKRVLEIGCGTGGILSFFKSKNFDCYGVDYENDHLDYARKNQINVSSSLEDIHEEFDIIVLSHVLEHLISFDDILYKCKKLLSKEGIIYVEVPSIESITKHYDYNILNFMHIAHVTHFTKNTFINFINLKGFEIKYINSGIHAIIKPHNNRNEIINNYKDTINILNNIKMKKKYIYPLKFSLNIIKDIIKKSLKKI